MIKEKDILIRVDITLKKQIQKKAKSLGLSVSAYVRFLITKNLSE